MKRFVLAGGECHCPVIWYSWGCRVEHIRDCPVYQWHHPVLTWLRKILGALSR